MSNVVAIVQARVGSTRLPGKVLADIHGQTMLERVVRRLFDARTLDSVVIATTELPADDSVESVAARLGVLCVRGSPDDVLSRYAAAAAASKAETIVRICSDCPLIDPAVVDLVVSSYAAAVPAVDYASNTIVRTFPRGLDTEVVDHEVLSRVARLAAAPHEREHVTPYIYEHPGNFRLLHVTGQRDYSELRWTVDTGDDLRLVREIYGRLGTAGGFGWRAVIELVERDPSLTGINAHIRQKALRDGAA